MPNISNIPYAEVNLKYDKELFVEEYDREIYPRSGPFIPIFDQWNKMQRLNHIWNVLSKEKFDLYDAMQQHGARKVNDQVTHQWDMVNLMQSEGGSPLGGGAYWRNRNRHNNQYIKKEFKDLQIVKWIQDNVPAQRIVGIHCVSIEPGAFATIHRDYYWPEKSPNPAAANGFFREGFCVLCLNISSGGSPLLWCLDHEPDKPRAVDADCFIISDYFFHAVPEVTSRRRQIRISFVPDEKFASLINYDTAVVLPDDYQYTA